MTDPRRAPGADLPEWVDAITAGLGVDRESVDVDRLLSLSGDVAHSVARPAVPVTMFVAGLAAARREEVSLDPDRIAQVLAFVESAAAAWAPTDAEELA